MAVNFHNDEEIARRLQAQFDAEDLDNRQREEKDWELAMAYSKAHTMSDSDSDATIDPDDLVSNGSPDLFAEEDVIPNRSAVKSKGFGKKSSSIQKKEYNHSKSELQKRVSKVHELSDSDSDKEVKKHVKKEFNRIPRGSPVLKKRKYETDEPSSNKKRKSMDSCGQKDSERESFSSSFDRHKISPFKKDNSVKLFTHKSSKSSSPSSSFTKIPSKHVMSESDSDNDMKQTKTKSVKPGSSFTKCDSSTSRKDVSSSQSDDKPLCKYGPECFRRNPSHLAEFSHTADTMTSTSSKEKPTFRKKISGTNVKKTGQDIFQENQPLSFYMTKVTGIPDIHNAYGAIGIKDILSRSMGKLEASCQFNYMFEVDWLVKQYPEEFRSKPLTLVHGEQRGSLATLLAETSPYSNIVCCQAKLEILYGTHHTKMMLLLYDSGMRVVIHTSNLIERDWYQKSQGVWVSPVFPKLPADSSSTDGKLVGDSPTRFKQDLLDYIAAYRAHKLTVWEKHIKAHDMSAAKVHIIGSVPGRHTEEQKSSWGHMKLRKILQKHGPEPSQVKTWPVIGQFSSIGSLGPTPETWVFKEWLQSLSTTKGMPSVSSKANLTLVFPSVDNVRVSLEGYPAGTSVPYSINTAKKQVYIHQHFRQWKSGGRGRSRACPHIKTYLRPSPDSTKTAWFLVTSANLSKAAWGAFEKNGNQLMIRSYEIGVLFLPTHFGCESFPVSCDPEEAITRADERVFPLPYDLPLTPYVKGDRPWMIDVPCMHAPDTNGNMWCPPL